LCGLPVSVEDTIRMMCWLSS